MRSSDLRRGTRGRRSLALLVGASALLGLGASIPATAQDAPPTVTGEDLFGTYDLESRGLGVQVTYTIESLEPVIGPVLDLGLPETLARFTSGPTGYGLASLAYPGGVPANLDALVTQSGGDGSQIPPYPIKSEAFYPAGPTESSSSQPGFLQEVVSDPLGVQATATFPAVDVPGLVDVAGVTSASRSAVEGKLAISRSRVALEGVSILGGVITIDSLVTDLVSVHDGTSGSTAGGTAASGVKFLGLDASLTGKGLVLKKAAPVEGPGAPLGGLLADVVGPLSAITGPLSDQLAGALSSAVPQVNDILAQAGITLALVDPHDVQVDSGAASRISSGLSLTFSYKGREQQAMVDLIEAIPAELKPALGPVPFPVTFLAENHLFSVGLAPASVSSLATPPFPSLDFPVDLPSLPFDPGTPAWSDTIAVGGFTTAPAPLPAPSGSPAVSGDPISALASGAVPAILVILALLASPLFGMGSSRLADHVLAETAATSCPIGLDKPPAPPRPL
ncbi:MAG: choice-of-anchor P family protein [Acidimicrobiales bacterium]